MLTPAQIAHFETFGFLILRQLYQPPEIRRIGELLDAQLALEREGKPYDPGKRQAMLGFIESHPELIRLLEEDRLYRPLEQLLGEDYLFSGSDGNLYSGDTPWHPDSDAQLLAIGYRRIKVALYLDPLTATTGALRIIPGSHRAPLFHALDRARGVEGGLAAAFGVPPEAIPATALASTPGDVVLFDSHCWHASFGGAPGRRMIALSYAQAATAPAHDELLKSAYAFNIRHIREQGYRQRDWMYGETFLRSERPRIRRLSRRLVELGLR